MIGQQLGNYRITERIGGGGVGVVWKAQDLVLERPVAIKALRPELAAREAVVERFRSEARTLARLNHPHIATLHALLEEGDALYMVMEYVEGVTLEGLLRSSGRLAPELACDLLLQALDGIGHAHAAGVVHRDVKSSNLMVDARGSVKVMDFGIARAVGSARMTRLGNLVGTPDFMAPEQIRGGEASERSDIYALGVLLHEMLTGELPFRRGSEFDVLRAHVEAPPPSVRAVAPEVPEAVERAVAVALAKEPERRFASTAAFAAALEAAGMRARATPVPDLSEASAQDGAGDSEAPTDVAEPEPAAPAAASAPAEAAAPDAEAPEAPSPAEPAPGPTRVLGVPGAEPTLPDGPGRSRARRRATWAALAATAAVAIGAGFLRAHPEPAVPSAEAPGAVAASRAASEAGGAPPLVGPPRPDAAGAAGAPGTGGIGGGDEARAAVEPREPTPRPARERTRPPERRRPEPAPSGERRGWVIRWE